eukprot:123164_1
MPQFGLGTWKSPPGQTRAAVECALQNGYTNLDTANDYNNEPEVGEGIESMINKGIITRNDLFVQSKLWNSNHRAEHIGPDLEQTLIDLKLDYVDSYVIHWPQACPSVINKATLRTTGPGPDHMSQGSMFPYDDDGYFVSDAEHHFTETWEAMQELVDQGKVRSIGLSNFNLSQVQEILDLNCKYQPTVLQNESHPYLQQKDFIDYCNINGIVFQSFSSLGSGDTNLAVHDSPSGVIPLKDEYITSLAQKYKKTNAQIILRWHVQRKKGSTALVSKSVTSERIISNIQVYDFELSQDDMDGFESINYHWRHLYWRETSNHPDYPFHDELPYKYQLEQAP